MDCCLHEKLDRDMNGVGGQSNGYCLILLSYLQNGEKMMGWLYERVVFALVLPLRFWMKDLIRDVSLGSHKVVDLLTLPLLLLLIPLLLPLSFRYCVVSA